MASSQQPVHLLTRVKLETSPVGGGRAPDDWTASRQRTSERGGGGRAPALTRKAAIRNAPRLNGDSSDTNELPPPSRRSFSHVRRVFPPRLWRSRSTLRAVIRFLPLVCALPLKFPLGVQAEGMQRSEQHSVILNDLMYINPLRPPRRTSPYVFLDVTSTRRRRFFFPPSFVCWKVTQQPCARLSPPKVCTQGRRRSGIFFFSSLTRSAHKVSR